jgi:hypothetical protein
MRKRFVQIGLDLVEVAPDYVPQRPATAAHNIIPDIAPYQSMVTGEQIMGRRQHREHLKAHGLVEVGNEAMKPYKTEPKVDWKRALRETLARKGML